MEKTIKWITMIHLKNKVNKMDFSILHQPKKIFLFQITLGDKRVKFQIIYSSMEIKS